MIDIMFVMSYFVISYSLLAPVVNSHLKSTSRDYVPLEYSGGPRFVVLCNILGELTLSPRRSCSQIHSRPRSSCTLVLMVPLRVLESTTMVPG
jgi:hypothetical protein